MLDALKCKVECMPEVSVMSEFGVESVNDNWRRQFGIEIKVWV